MDDISIFRDKSIRPTNSDLELKLGAFFDLWMQIEDIVFSKYPKGLWEWHFPGKKYGWSLRIKDKKRVIIYFLPRESRFKVAFVFGDKAVKKVLESDISSFVKTELSQAKKYAEGRGIRINIENEAIIPDIEQLIAIKLSNWTWVIDKLIKPEWPAPRASHWYTFIRRNYPMPYCQWKGQSP